MMFLYVLKPLIKEQIRRKVISSEGRAKQSEITSTTKWWSKRLSLIHVYISRLLFYLLSLHKFITPLPFLLRVMTFFRRSGSSYVYPLIRLSPNLFRVKLHFESYIEAKFNDKNIYIKHKLCPYIMTNVICTTFHRWRHLIRPVNSFRTSSKGETTGNSAKTNS